MELPPPGPPSPSLPLLYSTEWFPEEPIYAYPNKHSFLPTELLKLHVSLDGSRTQRFEVDIRGITAPLFSITTQLQGKAVDSTTGPGTLSASPLGDKDWRWPQASTYQDTPLSVRIPDETPPGIYRATLTALGADGGPLTYSASFKQGDTCVQVTNERCKPSAFLFVVRSRPQPTGPNGRHARPILYKLNLLTIHAYSATPESVRPDQCGEADLSQYPWRRSFYEGYSNQSPQNAWMTLSLRRPVNRTSWDEVSGFYDGPMLDWLARNDYGDQVDYCTDIDIHLDTEQTLLSRYDLLLIVGHDEYWSPEMRKHVETFRDNGGNIAFLAGNICFWKVALEEEVDGEPTSMRCDKGDDIRKNDGPDLWWRARDAANQPWQENTLTGVSTRNGGFRLPRWRVVICYRPTDEDPMPLAPPLVLQHTDHWCHWARFPTGLTPGALIAGPGEGTFSVIVRDGPTHEPVPMTLRFKELLIGYETDGAELSVAQSQPLTYEATAQDGTPENFAVLGVALLEPNKPAFDMADQQDEQTLRQTHWAVIPRERPGGIYAGTLGAYAAYGIVFTAGTTDWAKSLNYQLVDFEAPEGIAEVQRPAPFDDNGSQCLGNLHVHRITRNVIHALSSREKDVVAVGSFTAGSSPDILFQHRRTAEVLYWKMQGPRRNGQGAILRDAYNPPDLDWRVVGAYPWSTKPDLLLQNQRTGDLVLWHLDGIHRGAVSSIPEGTAPGRDWALVGVGDLNQDQKPDLLFQHQPTGALKYWLMNGLTPTAMGDIEGPALATWRVVGLAPLTADAQQHILFQNMETGALGYWLLTGTQFLSEGDIQDDGTSPLSADLKAMAFTHMGEPGALDLLFQNQGTGELSYCTLENLARTGLTTLTPNPWVS